jgi:serine O-acetyltransferase
MNRITNDITDKLLEALTESASVDHVCTCPLPHLESSGAIIGLMQQLLFPGYFTEVAVERSALRDRVAATAAVAFDLLRDEIAKCIFHFRKQPPSEAAGFAQRFMETLPGLVEVLDGDVEGAYLGDPAATGYDEIIVGYPGFRAVMTYRIAHELYRLGVPLLPRLMTEHAHSVTGIDIHPGARIGRNFFIDHGTGVVIGETTEIGDNVKLYQGVTLGALSFPTDEEGNLRRGFKRHPTIEDDVVIYSNASILGPVTIGRGSAIGGNVFLTHDVEAGSKVTIEKPENRIRRRSAPQ